MVTGATSITSTAFVGDITGDVTGTADTATVATTVTITDNESTNESNALIFTSGGDVDGGNIGLESDGTLTYNPSTGKVTATGFVGTLTGDVTGNTSGTAATVTTAAQSNITSLGTLTTLTVDNVIINGATIGHTGDTDLITVADGIATIAGEISVTTLDIGGTNVTTTAAEINLIDGGTSRGTTAVASGDGILINDGGTMNMTNVDTVSTYFASHSVGGGNIVTTGALNSGSITSGFGTIDTGSSAITTTGLISGGSLDIQKDGTLVVTMEDAGTSPDGHMLFRASRGSIASPSNLAGGSGIFYLDFKGYTNSGFNTHARINVTHASGTTSGSKMAFSTTDSGATLTTALTIDNEQDITVVGDIDMSSSGSLLNVGAAGNDYTATTLYLDSDNSGGANIIRVKNQANSANSEEAVVQLISGGTSAGNSYFNMGNGTNWWMMGLDNTGNTAGSAAFAISYTASGLGTNDAMRITAHGSAPEVSFQNQAADFDYACDKCGRHEAAIFTCCGKVEWHDDVKDFRAMSQQVPDALDYMEKVGIIQRSVDPNGKHELFTTMKMMWFVGSMAYQNRQRMDSHYQEQKTKLEKLEGVVATLMSTK